MGILELIIAAAFLVIVVASVLRTIARGQRSYRNFDVGREAGQLDPILRGAVLKIAWDYFDAAARDPLPCNASASPIDAAFAKPLAPGVRATVIDPARIDSLLPAKGLGEAGTAAKERCARNQTTYASPNFSNAHALYFCLLLEPDAGVTNGHAALLGNEVVFAELSLSFENQSAGGVVTCASYPAATTGVQQPLGTLVYAVYWQSDEVGGPIAHHYIASISLGEKP